MSEDDKIIKFRPSSEHYGYIQDQKWIHTDAGADYILKKHDDVLELIIQCTHSKEKGDMSDWHDDLDYYARETVPCKKTQAYENSEFKVHEGLYKQYLSFRNEFLDACYADDVKKIYISGFSLGGGVTKLAVQDAVYHFAMLDDKGKFIVKHGSIQTTKEIQGISYEGPRVFCTNFKLAKFFNKHMINICTMNDPVVHQPNKVFVMPFVKLWFFPFKIKWTGKLDISFWSNYGKTYLIGRPWRFIPIQHYPSQVSKALMEKFHE